MNEVVRCARCKEPIEGKAVVKFNKVYCSEACAYEATGRPGPTICGHDNGAAAIVRKKR